MKLRLNGVSRKLINIIEDFLPKRCQRVVLNGQGSKWAAVKAGVPEGSMLGPMLGPMLGSMLGFLQMTLLYFRLFGIRIYQITL